MLLRQIEYFQAVVEHILTDDIGCEYGEYDHSEA